MLLGRSFSGRAARQRSARDPYSELDHLFAQGVTYLTDCLIEGVITEEMYVTRMLEDVASYRERLVGIIRAAKEGR